MPMFDYERQPEFAGPVTEPRTRDGRPVLDLQALAQRTIRLPQLDPAADEYVPLSGPNPYLHERENASLAARYDAGEEALRSLVQGAARQSGADYATASRTAAEVLRRVPAASGTPGITEQALEELGDRVAAVVADALAGTQPKPRRPHRRTSPVPDAEPAEPEPAETPEEKS